MKNKLKKKTCSELPHLQAAYTSSWETWEGGHAWRERRVKGATPVLCLRGVTGLLVVGEGWERDVCDAAGSADSCLVGFNGGALHTTYGPQISLSP